MNPVCFLLHPYGWLTLEGDGQRGLLPSREKIELSIAAERTITMERKEEKVDSTSIAFSPLETNSSTQTAYHQAAYPDQAVTKRCPAPASNQSRTRSRWDRPTQLGQLLNDTEGKEKNIIRLREQTDNTAALRQRLKRSGQRSAISPLPHSRDQGP